MCILASSPELSNSLGRPPVPTCPSRACSWQTGSNRSSHDLDRTADKLRDPETGFEEIRRTYGCCGPRFPEADFWTAWSLPGSIRAMGTNRHQGCLIDVSEEPCAHLGLWVAATCGLSPSGIRSCISRQAAKGRRINRAVRIWQAPVTLP